MGRYGWGDGVKGRWGDGRKGDGAKGDGEHGEGVMLSPFHPIAHLPFTPSPQPISVRSDLSVNFPPVTQLDRNLALGVCEVEVRYRFRHCKKTMNIICIRKQLP